MHSPSKRGDFLGRMFDRGIAEGIAAAVPDIMRQSKSAAVSASDAFESNIRDLALRGFAGSDPLLGYRSRSNGSGGISQPAMLSMIAPVGSTSSTVNNYTVVQALRPDELVRVLEHSQRGHLAMTIFEDTPRAMQNKQGRR